MNNGNLPWDMEEIKDLVVDDKDPLVYKKTMQYEIDRKDWDKEYLKKKMSVSVEELTAGLPKAVADYINYCERLKFD